MCVEDEYLVASIIPRGQVNMHEEGGSSFFLLSLLKKHGNVTVVSRSRLLRKDARWFFGFRRLVCKARDKFLEEAEGG